MNAIRTARFHIKSRSVCPSSCGGRAVRSRAGAGKVLNCSVEAQRTSLPCRVVRGKIVGALLLVFERLPEKRRGGST